MAAGHYPVLLEEAAEALVLGGDEKVVDATFGGGGHARRILRELGPGGTLIGVDRDPGAAARASRLAEEDRRFTFLSGAYDEVLEGLVGEGEKVDAVLFDLGLSSYQIDEDARGFSYVREGPLDMRMDPSRGESAADFLNSAEAAEISDVLVRYGDVPRGEARRVAREIERRRPLGTTLELSEAVRAAVGWKERGGNPAKRVFQAVRVYVNDELGGLQRALGAAERLLAPGGRLVAITFHSGEDRMVKRFISEREGQCVCPPELPVCSCGASPIFRRGIIRKPSAPEIEENPRSSSARLRSAIRTAEPPEAEGPPWRNLLVVAPQRKPQYRTDPAVRRPEDTPKRAKGHAQGRARRRVPGEGSRRKAGRGRAFVVLVVVPLLLMLGSVYLHTVASGLKGEAARLEEEKVGAEGEGERLEVRLTELSEPERIRALARNGLRMRDPDAQDFETYDGRHGEDVVDEGEQKEKTNE